MPARSQRCSRGHGAGRALSTSMRNRRANPCCDGRGRLGMAWGRWWGERLSSGSSSPTSPSSPSSERIVWQPAASRLAHARRRSHAAGEVGGRDQGLTAVADHARHVHGRTGRAWLFLGTAVDRDRQGHVPSGSAASRPSPRAEPSRVSTMVTLCRARRISSSTTALVTRTRSVVQVVANSDGARSRLVPLCVLGSQRLRELNARTSER